MGELHLEIIVDRLKREFGVEINQGAPQVNYKEAIRSTVQHREVFKKQTGGRGKFADIIVEIGPADEGVTGLQFIDQVKGGNVPREYIPAVEKGFKSAMANGVLAGFEVPSLKVTLLDGSFHPVDSDALSFEICARMAFRRPQQAPRTDHQHGLEGQREDRQGQGASCRAVRLRHHPPYHHFGTCDQYDGILSLCRASRQPRQGGYRKGRRSPQV